MITYYQNIDNKIQEVTELQENCWVNIYPPFDYEAIKTLSNKLDIYIDYFSDALDIDEQSRYEEDDDVKFILIKTPMRNDNLVSSTRASFVTIPISIVIKGDIIITTSLFKNPLIDSIINHKRKTVFEDLPNFILTIFEQNINYFHYYLRQINLKFNEFERKFENNPDNSDFLDILHLQNALIFFETNLRAYNLMLVKMKRTNFLNTRSSEELDDFFDEIIIENHQAIEMTEVYSRILESTMHTITSILSNNVNLIMKRLTGVTMVLMVPSLISGLWGMNVPVPFQNNAYGFYVLSILALAIVMIISLLFIKRKWL